VEVLDGRIQTQKPVFPEDKNRFRETGERETVD
jgi:hypothetical protein